MEPTVVRAALGWCGLRGVAAGVGSGPEVLRVWKRAADLTGPTGSRSAPEPGRTLPGGETGR